MDPFLVNLATDTDLWMFVASSGGLTAGRVDAGGSLFPYVTSDQLYDAHRHSGPVTLLRVEKRSGESTLWRPFSEGAFPGASNNRKPGSGSRTGANIGARTGATAHAESASSSRSPQPGGIERNLYKSTSGNQITFEEIEHDLGLAFRYRWAGCDAFGWVRTATLENRGTTPLRISLLDGLRNVLPWGAPLGLYQTASNLVDAYKQSELDPATGLGIFSLTAGITDRPEALEVLRANTVWCCGLDAFRAHLSLDSLRAFTRGRPFPGRLVKRGGRGNYLVSATIELEPGQSVRWHLAADAGLDHVRIQDLRRALLSGTNLTDQIDGSLRGADDNLKRIVASADGLQLTGHPEAWSHHFANVLYNNMRGGVFLHNDDVPMGDLYRLLRVRNPAVAERHRVRFEGWPERMPVGQLRQAALASGDQDFARLMHEYLPLYFGRRHGDPSRPWNRFEIRVRDRNGQRVLHHEGNWRDIFQNWEALGISFPSYLPSMVARFLSASTVDGFNPYRITQEGVDWEVPSPDDPWSNIGYWGDHQIVYMLRLLEALNRYDPAALPAMLGEEIFSYADVPYRIKPYEDILRDPAATIDYDTEHATRIDARVESVGTDGRLLHGQDGSVYHANLLEKLLVPALAKLSNLIPGAGIWMNTQRPEWNDANNALAGGSVSVVTLCHLRRYLAFLVAQLDSAAAGEGSGRLAGSSEGKLPVSVEVVEWFERVATILGATGPGAHTAQTQSTGVRSQAAQTGSTGPSPPTGDPAQAGAVVGVSRRCRDAVCRKQVMDALGQAFSDYRAAVYQGGFTGRRELAIRHVASVCRTALGWIDASIAANRREDGLYHTYNQLAFSADMSRVEVIHLQEMLEGQVAVLSSGAIAPDEALRILERMFSSALYRADQNSFMLYPKRERPGFMSRNRIPEEAISAIPLLGEMEARGEQSLWARDAAGIGRFHGDLRNARDAEAVLDDLKKHSEWSRAVSRDRAAILELFEAVFEHRSYTGRSAVMYGYEGIGCIYWHMVAKLLLAVQENVVEAVRRRASPEVVEALVSQYRRVQAGLGYRKTPSEYGAFPADPYSHTPYAGGAKQPGMTGQVKEEILARYGELGVSVEKGEIHFAPRLLPAGEFMETPAEFGYYDVEGRSQTLPLPSGSLAFTFCQVPVLYRRTKAGGGIRVTFADGTTRAFADTRLGPDLGARIFERDGHVHHIAVEVPNSALACE